jgi:transposase
VYVRLLPLTSLLASFTSLSKKVQIMMTTPIAPLTVPITRYVGLDVSTRSVMVAAVDPKQVLVLKPKKIPLDRFQSWASQNLGHSDAVVLEATVNAWRFADQLQSLVGQVTVANPNQIKLITQAKVKTDAKDAVHLARILAAGLVSAVWVPPQPVRDLRALINHRQRLIQQRTRSRNRLHAILQTHHLLPPEGEPFAAKNQLWWESLTLSPTQKLLIKQEMRVLADLEPLLKEVETTLVQLSTQSEWLAQSTLLIQLPGVGVLTAMTVLSAVGDITRFPTAKQLVGYSGLGTSVYATGQTYRTGSITKQGRAELRAALIESAWSAVGQEGHWKSLFEKLAARLGKGKAIVAVARKLLVVVWHVLTKQATDQQAEEIQVARRLTRWAYKLHKDGRRGLGGMAFVRQRLQALRIGAELTEIKWGGNTLSLPPPPVALAEAVGEPVAI